VPPELAAIIEKMMAKDPRDRYLVPAAVIEALEPWVKTPLDPVSLPASNRLSPLARRTGSAGGVPSLPVPGSAGNSSVSLRRSSPPLPPAPPPPSSSRRDTPMDLMQPAHGLLRDTVHVDLPLRNDQLPAEPTPSNNGPVQDRARTSAAESDVQSNGQAAPTTAPAGGKPGNSAGDANT